MNLLKKFRSIIKRLVKKFYFILGILICLSIIFISISYLQPDFNKGFLIDKQQIFPYYKYALYTHILASPIAFLAGVFQLNFTKSKWHRRMGKIYVVTILFLAAPSGFFMAFYTIGGLPSNICFIIMSFLWFYFTLIAYRSIKKGKVAKHKQFMIRSFILTNSAILLRLLMFINNQYLLEEYKISYTIIAWLSWLPWLITYELYLLRTNQSTTSQFEQ